MKNQTVLFLRWWHSEACLFYFEELDFILTRYQDFKKNESKIRKQNRDLSETFFFIVLTVQPFSNFRLTKRINYYI